ncbi:sugar transferase [Trichlorobacter sp.]|uniref:sugar transferase n=1 Tax=Trichlorobacter sp. TaxID=2911007 RepID=UPI002A35CE73|nr:sugar transferase [Trichlorobacter sp.]MDY0384161.1 sugar transferase [Trichlorobacter sp.]
MLKQQARLLTGIAITLDLLLVFGSFLTAFYLRHPYLTNRELNDYFWFLLLALPLWFGALYASGIYGSLRTRTIWSFLTALLKAYVIAGCIAAAAIFIFDPHTFSRLLFFWFIVISFVAIATGKLFIRLFLSLIRQRGLNTRDILLVGDGLKAQQMRELIELHACWGMRLVDTITCAGPACNIIDYCKKHTVDEVVFCLPATEMARIEQYVTELDQLGVTSRMVLDLVDFPAHRQEVSLFHDTLPMLSFYAKAFSAPQLLAKRFLDIAGALVGLLFFGLMYPFVALAIKLESPGPIFFGQLRLGEQGRPFRCWKLRSMIVDAEQHKQDLMAHNEMNGQMFKIKDDPRVTRVGRFIRKTSIDEFPQFWNVLKGEMSLVGTRPPTPDEVANYEDWHRKRICIKPGITGLWQVSGRNQIQDFDEVARLDIRYVENWSIWLDIKILFQTLWVVTLGRGAS